MYSTAIVRSRDRPVRAEAPAHSHSGGYAIAWIFRAKKFWSTCVAICAAQMCRTTGIYSSEWSTRASCNARDAADDTEQAIESLDSARRLEDGAPTSRCSRAVRVVYLYFAGYRGPRERFADLQSALPIRVDFRGSCTFTTRLQRSMFRQHHQEPRTQISSNLHLVDRKCA